jgi:hypothetical protein
MPGLILDANGVPVVGSRSPLPQGGTGGGLSPEALLRLRIMQRMAASQPQPNLGFGSLPANPLTDPRAIADWQMRQAGQ